MNFRLTAVVFGLAVLLLVALLVSVLREDEGAKSGPTGALFDALSTQGVAEKDIDRVEIRRTQPADETLVLTKSEGKWAVVEPVKAKADQAAVADLIRDLAKLKPVEFAERSDNLTTAGLNPPSVQVALKQGDTGLTFQLGKTTIGGAKAVTFVATSAAPGRVVAVSKSALGGVFRAAASGQGGEGEAWKLAKWLPDFRLKKVLGGELRDAATEATALKLSGGGKELALTRGGAGAAWNFTAPANYGPADDAGDTTAPGAPAAAFTGVRPLLTALTNLQVAGNEDYLEAPGDLAQYGLQPGSPTAVRVELGGPAGGEVVTLGNPVPPTTPPAAGQPVPPATKVFAKVEGDPAVFRVNFDKLDALKATLNSPRDLRDKNLLAASLKDKLDALDLTSGGQTLKLRKVSVPGETGGPQWLIYGAPTGPVAAKVALVNQMLDLLTRPRAGREALAAPDDAAFAAPEGKVTVKAWADSIKPTEGAPPAAGGMPPEPAITAPPAAEIVFGRREGATVFARLSAPGRTVDLKPSDAIPNLAAKPRVDWIDPKFASFKPTSVTRLTFNRGAEAFDLEAAPAGGYTFAAPASLKGRSADANKVNAILGQLAALTADRVSVEQPTPDDLKRLNLDPASPRMRVTVAVKDDVNKDRTYEFGADADDKSAVAARQSGRPAVAQVSRAAFDKLTTEDLRDPVVYRLDPSQVTRLKVRGWQGLLSPQPLVYELEKKAGAWASVGPTTANPDAAKVERALQLAGTLTAERYAGPIAPAQGLEVTTNPSGLELTLERSGQPVTVLVLGNPAGEAGRVFATSNLLNGEAVVVNAAELKALFERPAGFQK